MNNEPEQIAQEMETWTWTADRTPSVVMHEWASRLRSHARIAAQREAELVKLLDDARVTMKHAQVFISTREKMHPTGRDLYRELLGRIDAALTPEKGR